MVSEFNKRTLVAVDIETSGLNPIDSRILLAQFGFEDTAYVVNTHSVDLSPVLPFLSSKRWLKLIHNASFEASFFQHFYKTDINNIFDTYLAEVLISFDSGHSLEAVALKYANMILNKDIRKTFHGMRPMNIFSDKQLQYAADDVVALFPVYRAQSEALKASGQLEIAEVEFELANVVANMRLTGVPIDRSKWQAKFDAHLLEHEKSRIRMNELIFDNTDMPEQIGMFVRDSINLNSTKQLKTGFAALGIDIDSTKEQVIALIDHPAAKELLNYRKLQKIGSSYGASFLDKIHPFTNRIHPDFQQIGAATGRFACREPNVQQIPEEFRECVAEEGYKIIAADYSQMELRILAQLSGDELFVNALRSGADLHKTTASLMFNIPLDSVDKEKRFVAKTLNFGITYGMGINKLKDMLNAEAEKNGWDSYSFEKARALLQQYKRTYVTATKWLLKTGEEAFARGYATTIMGRRRLLSKPYGLEGKELEAKIASIKRQGANTPVQGSNADITKLAMVNLYRDLHTYGYRAHIINQVHDEIVVLAHNSQAETIRDMIVESMVESAEKVITQVPVKVDASISDYWHKG